MHLDLGSTPEQEGELAGGDARSIGSQHAVFDESGGDGRGGGTHLEESERHSRTDEGGNDPSSSQRSRVQQTLSNQTCPFAALQVFSRAPYPAV